MGEPWQKFHDWVNTNMVTGTNFCGVREVEYVPVSKLLDYWTPAMIQEVWNHQAGESEVIISPDYTEIRESYIRIFSILVWIHKIEKTPATIHYITHFHGRDSGPSGRFTDKNLWLTATEDAALRIFTGSDQGRETCEAFCKHQWRFNHILFPLETPQHYGWLEKRMVFPILLEEGKTLSSGLGKPMVKMHKVRPGSGLEIIVVKEYDKTDQTLKESFVNEKKAYVKLVQNCQSLEGDEDQELVPSCFLRFFGSFEQGDKGFLLLEHADQGSLLDFFTATRPPWEFEELYEFWHSLSNLLEGLGLLYHHTAERLPRSIHQDLKPANIFVFACSKDSYGYRFKIGDLGSSSSRFSSLHSDNGSTRMYNAPELDNDDGVTWQADVWSLGCVLMEAAVWVVFGDPGRREYFAKRKEETKGADGEERAYTGSFHNNRKELEATKNVKGDISRCRRVSDTLTEGVAKIIMDSMLVVDPNGRKRPRDIFHAFSEHLKAIKDPDPESPRPTRAGHDSISDHGSRKTQTSIVKAPSQEKGKQIDYDMGLSLQDRPHSAQPNSKQLYKNPTPPQESNHSIQPVINNDKARLPVPTPNPPLAVGGQGRSNEIDKASLRQVLKYWEDKKGMFKRAKEPPGLEKAVEHFKDRKAQKQVGWSPQRAPFYTGSPSRNHAQGNEWYIRHQSCRC